MILIISEEDDSTTDRVISWLKHYQTPYLRINNTTPFVFQLATIGSDGSISCILSGPGFAIDLKKISGYWYRRGKLQFRIQLLGEQQMPGLMQQSNNFLFKEFNTLSEFVYDYLHSLSLSIGDIRQNQTNKLSNLRLAAAAGMLVPQSWILTQKQDVLTLLGLHHKLLTKPLTQGGLSFENEQLYFDGFSNLIGKDEVDKFHDSFAPTLFQQYIDKAYELRVFYFEGVCYASAIFSQLDERTKVDFRNYNDQRPNRTPPFLLPEHIREAICTFMERVGMKSGSLDVLVDTSGNYYFLEVNPIGQFYQVSHPCNYYLEERVAQYFSHGKA